MMMNFRRDKVKGPRFSRWPSVGGLVLLLVLIVFGGTWLTQALSGPALWLGRPFWQLSQNVSGVWQNAGAAFLSKESLLAENKILKTERDLFQARATDRDQLAADNAALRTLLGQRPATRPAPLVARVLVGASNGPFDILVLDLGRDNGARALQPGDPVLAAPGIRLGEVAEVYGLTSKVRLRSVAGERTNAVLGPERVPITLLGRGGGNLVATMPRGVAVVPGGTAFLSGPDTDEAVAVVVAIVPSADGASQEVFFHQPVQARTLKYVLVQTS